MNGIVKSGRPYPVASKYSSSVVITPGAHSTGSPPPMALDAEAAVLGSIIAMAGEVDLVQTVSFLRPEHFYSEGHRWLFQAILDIRATGGTPDFTACVEQLKVVNRINQVGDMMTTGGEYLIKLLTHQELRSDLVRQHGEIVQGMWRLRETIVACDTMIAEVYETPPTDVQAFLEGSAKKLAKVALDSPKATARSAIQILKGLGEKMRMAAKEGSAASGPTEFTTSLPTLDAWLGGGLVRGKKFTICASPGHGKTAWGKQVALANAQNGVPTGMFVSEQTAEELMTLFIASIAKLDSRAVAKVFRTPAHGLSHEDMQKLNSAAAAIGRLPLYLEHGSALTVDDIATRTRELQQRLVAEGKSLGVVVVDHLHRLKPAPGKEGMPKNEQIDYATEVLKQLAQDANVAIVELAQRKGKSQDGKAQKPTEGDVYWSKKVEQESDVVAYIWEPSKGRYEVVVTKARDGETGDIPVFFDKSTSSLGEFDEQRVNW